MFHCSYRLFFISHYVGMKVRAPPPPPKSRWKEIEQPIFRASPITGYGMRDFFWYEIFNHRTAALFQRIFSCMYHIRTRRCGRSKFHIRRKLGSVIHSHIVANRNPSLHRVFQFTFYPSYIQCGIGTNPAKSQSQYCIYELIKFGKLIRIIWIINVEF